MQYDLLLKRPKLTIVIFTLITLVISSQALGVVISSDIELYMPSGQPTVETLNQIRKDWPVDTVVVYITADNVTDVSKLKEIDAVERALNPPGNDSIVYTASIASFLRDTNAVFPVIGSDMIPNHQTKVDLLLRLIPEEMKKNFVTEDGKHAVIIIATEKGVNADQLLEENVYPVLETTTETEMTATGTITMYKETVDWVMGRIYPVVLVSGLLLVLTILAFHRSMKAVLISLAPIGYAIGLTFGTIGMMPVQFAPTVIAVIPLLAALGIAYALHMVNHYAEKVKETSQEEALRYIIATTGKAVLLSAVTTIVGFASLLSSTMPPIENMGLAFLIGVLYCFIATMVMVPALLVLLHYRQTGIRGWDSFSKLVRYKKHILLVFVVLTALSMAALPGVSPRTSVWGMMPGKMPSSQAMHNYSEEFNSGQPGVVEIETGPEGVLEPSFLHNLESMEKAINVGIKNASAYSIVDVVKRLNMGTIPATKEEVKNLVEDKLGEKYRTMMLSDGYNKTLLYVNMPIMPVGETRRAVDGVNQILGQYDNKIDGSITSLAGLSSVTVAINGMLMEQQLQFTFLSLLLVFTCLLLVFRSFKYAAVTFLPILIILVWQPGALLLTNTPLNVATIMVSSVAIGAGIDFSVHVTERVRDELEERPPLEAVKIAIARKSPPLVETTLALIAGGIPIVMMEYELVTQFIMLVLVMLVFACVASLLGLAAIYSYKNGRWLERWP